MTNNKLSINWVDSLGKAGTTNISYINANATDANLKAFAVMLNDLTTNTFVSVTKTVITDITNAETEGGN